MQIPTYPQESEDAGPHFWGVFHNVASLYPMRPNPRHKREFRNWFDYTLDHYVCPDPCIKNAKKYLRANPLDLSSRKTLSHDLCEFHNNVRQENGQQTAQCDLVLGEPLMKDISSETDNDNSGDKKTDTGHQLVVQNEASDNQSPPSTESRTNENIDVDNTPKVQVLDALQPYTHQDTNEKDRNQEENQVQVYPDVSGALNKYKKSSSQIFKELCREEKLPYPTIYHRPCPADMRTSCTSFPLDGNGKIAGKAVVYLNPYNAGVKTIAHEFKHYHAKMKGMDELAEDEDEVELRALKFIQERFPGDEEGKTYNQTYYEGGIKTSTIQERMASRYPRYAGRVFIPETPERPKEEGEEQGFLKVFDGAYGILEKPFGLAKESLNLAYTPEIISAVTQTIVESNMSPIGSLLVSSLLGLGIGGFVIMNKPSIVEADRMLLSEISAHFTANVIRYANKDAAIHVMDDAERLGQAVAALDGGQVVNILTGRSMFGGYDDGAGKQHMPLDLLPPAPPRFMGSGVPPPPIPTDLLGFAATTDPYLSGEMRFLPRASHHRAPARGRARAGARGAAPGGFGPGGPQSGIPMPFVKRQGEPTSIPATPGQRPIGRTRPAWLSQQGIPPNLSREEYAEFVRNQERQRRRLRGEPPFRPIMTRRRRDEQEQDQRRLISGIDEEGFYHGSEAEVESLEGEVGPTNSVGFEGYEGQEEY